MGLRNVPHLQPQGTTGLYGASSWETKRFKTDQDGYNTAGSGFACGSNRHGSDTTQRNYASSHQPMGFEVSARQGNKLTGKDMEFCVKNEYWMANIGMLSDVDAMDTT